MKLDEYMDSRREKPFDWHRNNCGHFVAGWVEKMEGKTVELPETLKAQARLKARDGGVPAAVTRALNRQPLDEESFAQTGDVAAVLLPGKRGDRYSLGIVSGHRVILLSPEGGFVFAGTQFVTRAWPVGR